MPRPNYKKTVEWIALNDEPTVRDVDVMSGIISVVLVADIWGYDPERVARDVVNYRKRHNI